MKIGRSRPAPLVKLGFFAMGTDVSITVSAAGHRRRREEAAEAIAEVERVMQDFGTHWWAWGNGALARINAELAACRVRERGFADAIVDAGGNLAVRGARADRPWRIGIRNPRSDPDRPTVLATLAARDEAVNTHGDDQRYFEFDKVRYTHLIDPATGWPARGLSSLTVVHRDGTLAEAGGAALFVAGRHGWRRLARKLGLNQVLVVMDDGEIQVTTDLAARIKTEPEVSLRVVS